MGGLRWQMSDVAVGQLQVKFEGDIVDGVDLKDLLPNLHGEVSFDLGGIQRINSAGIKGWIAFMREATQLAALSLERCSPTVVLQLSMIAGFGVDARVVSVLLPYACDACGREYQHLLTCQADSSGIPSKLPCPDCTEPMEMDDAPESYLAVMSESQR